MIVGRGAAGTVTAMQPSAPSPITVKSGLYWQRKPILGFWAEPVVLSMGDGTLSMTTRTATAFHAPASEVTAKFSKLGTMALTVAGKRYPILGQGGTLSPKFTPAQLEEIAEAGRVAEAAAASGDTEVAAAFGVAGRTVPEMGSAISQWTAMAGQIRPWREIFAANRVTVTNP